MVRLVLPLSLLLACSSSGPSQPDDGTPPVTSQDGRIALNDLGAGTYKGFVGGLYPGGSNTMPAVHAIEGRRRAALITPRDTAGVPRANGRIIVLSVSMSNGTQEFCASSGYVTCASWTFMGRAAVDPDVNHTSLVLLNGARGGQVTDRWTSPTSAEYDRIRDAGLKPLGLSEKQVQAAWVKMANSNPRDTLPSADADAYALHAGLGDVLRALKTRYPNLQMVFLSSRIYAGFATTTLNPEPFAYEGGFANKWVIEDQIRQASNAATASRAGNVDYRTGTVPWVAWGPYLWAAEAGQSRSDGLFYERADFEGDGTHPSTSGEGKVGSMLHTFFKTSEFTSCWFNAGRTC